MREKFLAAMVAALLLAPGIVRAQEEDVIPARTTPGTSTDTEPLPRSPLAGPKGDKGDPGQPGVSGRDGRDGTTRAVREVLIHYQASARSDSYERRSAKARAEQWNAISRVKGIAQGAAKDAKDAQTTADQALASALSAHQRINAARNESAHRNANLQAAGGVVAAVLFLLICGIFAAIAIAHSGGEN